MEPVTKNKNIIGIKFNNLATKTMHNTLMPLLFGLLGLALGFISLAYAMTLQGKSQYIPYLVTVDTNGSLLTHGELKENHQISKNATATFICDFLEGLYNVYLDKQLQVNTINQIYAQIELGSKAQDFADSYYQSNNVLETSKELIQKATIQSIVMLTGQTYQLDFEVYTKSKTVDSLKKYKAIITFKQKALTYTKLDDLRLNPLGIFITQIAVSQRIEAANSWEKTKS